MKVLLGVTGGIAAYKAAELVRALQSAGLDVQVAMTESAQRFVQPLTFAALTGKPVFTSLWQPTAAATSDDAASFEIEHITVAQSIDLLVVAPATANTLARFAHGLADDFLSALYLAVTCPVVVAPAMNVNMWNHPATAANLKLLEQRGVHVVEPEAGYLACGMTGSGRLAPIDTIASHVLAMLHPVRDLAGETILVTAGGTREPIDPVRFIGNRSSGKMGHALAEAAASRGATVTLVTSSALPASPDVAVVPVTTAAEMAAACNLHAPEATIVIKAAAVSDFRPRLVSPTKLRREAGLTLELEPNEDIVASLVQHKRPGTLVIAFAAESQDLEAGARAKLLLKRTDAIVANDISSPEFGFDSDRNAALFITADKTVTLAPASKREIAERILDNIVLLRQSTPKPTPAPITA